jgi:hypothetical protein
VGWARRCVRAHAPRLAAAMGRAARGRRRCGVGPVSAVACAVLAFAAPAGGAQPFACGTLSGAAATQCAALGDFYVALNGSSWRSNSGWADASGAAVAPAVCSFYGVTCDANGLVTQLCVPRAAARARARRSASAAVGRRGPRVARTSGFSQGAV